MQSTTLNVSSRDSVVIDWQRAVAVLAIILSAAVILAHALLTAAGGWGGDEYFNFHLFREHGLEWLFVRLVHWSPRPSSDGVLYLYSLAVNHWHRPLITPFLIVLWIILGGSTIISAWQCKSAGLLPRVASACTILAMFLLGHRVNDLFYWPMGATPYLLDLAGITVVAIQIISGGTLRRSARLGCAAALAIAATSSETGLFFALTFTIVLFLLEIPSLRQAGSAALKENAWHLVPLLISIGTAALLLYIVAHNPARGIDQTSPYFHQFGASLAATLREFVPDLIRGDGSSSAMPGLAWLLTYVLLFTAFCWACRVGFVTQPRWQEVKALSAGLIGCYALTLFTSYYEYSQRVHEPQTAFRRCLVILGLLLAARIVTSLRPQHWRLPDAVGPLCLCAALCVGMVPRLPGLVADYRLLPQIRQARDLTWDSGADRTSATLRFVVPPQGEVINELIPQPEGVVTLGAPGTEWWMTGLMQFFGKHQLQVLPLAAIPPQARENLRR